MPVILPLVTFFDLLALTHVPESNFAYPINWLLQFRVLWCPRDGSEGIGRIRFHREQDGLVCSNQFALLLIFDAEMDFLVMQ